MRCGITILWIVLLLQTGGGLLVSPPRRHQSIDYWAHAKKALQRPDCCVVSISGLQEPLKILQEHWAISGQPSHIDLRARLRTSTSTKLSSSDDMNSGDTLNQDGALVADDCLRVCQSVNQQQEKSKTETCAAALKELAVGVASLAEEDGPQDVFVRIVCAADYRARDPLFHTDKAPLRGYVTLCGPGTEFRTRVSTLQLRTLGTVASQDWTVNSVRQAQELEFIVMKGDYYSCDTAQETTRNTSSDVHVIEEKTKSAKPLLPGGFWKRALACVHRSPPSQGGRRVIVSFDLADGDDDREWYQAGQKREWRSGMTQRKSRLVS